MDFGKCPKILKNVFSKFSTNSKIFENFQNSGKTPKFWQMTKILKHAFWKMAKI
jgi:hypothetical protein